jgi:prevent-host-death family protein
MVEARARFAELIDAVFHRGEHVEIRRHGRVVARLMPPEAPDRAGWHRATGPEPRGLQGIVGAWAEVPDEVIDEMVRDIYEARERELPRPFDFGSDEE